ncbi:MAG: COX15/CtaA family protein [Bryobacter sp.]|nr:COX15/CtaA family protein [Bryobacter sp.]
MLAKFAWFYCAYLIFVILFGAWVRISGSGAGCGNHWPTCEGEVIPTALSVEKTIEFTHRLTSGLSGFLGIGLLVAAWRTPARKWAIASFVFLLIEAFIGAVLVKKELVAGDTSTSRAIVIALHLANTLALMFCTVAAAIRSAAPATLLSGLGRGPLVWALTAVVLTSMTGAITALGDTLFPTQPALGPELWAKVREDLRPVHHFLVRLRIVHPLVAMASAGYLLYLGTVLQRQNRNGWVVAALGMTLGQVALGFLNILLAAPPWMQIAHLALGQGLWLVLVRLFFLLPARRLA